MTNFYIDESGSMTNNSTDYKQPFFIISIIKVNDDKILRRNLKRFVSDNLKILKKIDTTNKMFLNEKFLELKGASFNAALKRKFVKEIIKDKPFELYYIKVLNSRIDEKFFINKARAFNYLLKLFFIHNLRNGNFDNTPYNVQIDERNVKTQAKLELEGYLNTELMLSECVLDYPLIVKYFDSVHNKFIQVADVFANLYYSECVTNAYSSTIQTLKNEGILKEIFTFPKKN